MADHHVFEMILALGRSCVDRPCARVDRSDLGPDRLDGHTQIGKKTHDNALSSLPLHLYPCPNPSPSNDTGDLGRNVSHYCPQLPAR
jgi:hypothetical protein